MMSVPPCLGRVTVRPVFSPRKARAQPLCCAAAMPRDMTGAYVACGAAQRRR